MTWQGRTTRLGQESNVPESASRRPVSRESGPISLAFERSPESARRLPGGDHPDRSATVASEVARLSFYSFANPGATHDAPRHGLRGGSVQKRTCELEDCSALADSALARDGVVDLEDLRLAGVYPDLCQERHQA